MDNSGFQIQIKKGWFKRQKELDPDFFKPLCSKCFATLKVKDYVDELHPEDSKLNCCQKCYKGSHA